MTRIPGLRNTHPLPLLKRSATSFLQDDMTTYAAALSYSALFALFPFLIFIIALLGFLGLPEFFDWVLDQAETAMPEQAFWLVNNVITEVRGQTQGGLMSFGVIAAIWAASGGVRSVMNAMNVVFDVPESRPFALRYLLSVAYTLGLAILLIACTALLLAGPQAIEWVADQAGMGDLFVWLWTWLRWPAQIVLLMLIASLVYHFAPNTNARFVLITPGAVLAVMVWVVMAVGFSLYVSRFANYSATYGSLGGIVIVLFFFNVSSLVLLFGAEVNAQLARTENTIN